MTIPETYTINIDKQDIGDAIDSVISVEMTKHEREKLITYFYEHVTIKQLQKILMDGIENIVYDMPLDDLLLGDDPDEHDYKYENLEVRGDAS